MPARLPVTLLRTDITGFVGHRRARADRRPDSDRVVAAVRVVVRRLHRLGVPRLRRARRSSRTAAGAVGSCESPPRTRRRARQRASVDVGHAGDPVWRVRASSEGTWGDALTFTLRERNPAQIVTNNNDPEGAFSVVANVHGFRRGTHVRCSAETTPVPVWKVVAAVDPHRSRIYWVHPEKSRRLDRYDASAEGTRPRRADRDPQRRVRAARSSRAVG